MADIITNRAKFLALERLLTGAGGALDLRLGLVTGTATGVDDPDLNTVADLDAVTGVSIHTERLAFSDEAASEDDTNNRADVEFSTDLVFAADVGVTAQAAFLYEEGSGSDATRQLIAVYTTGFPLSLDGGLEITAGDLLRAT